MPPHQKTWKYIAGLNGFMAILMGAVGAHMIANPALAPLADKASLYQLIHAVLLLWLASRKGREFWIIRWFFMLAIVLFCGSLYLKALTGWPEATRFAPAGGICFMIGWLMVAMVSDRP